MTEIDRRTLFGAVGAGLVLAACTPGEDDANNQAAECDRGGESEGVQTGESSLWGDAVTKTHPDGVQSGFTPDHLCAVYVKFGPAGATVLQGHVKLNGTEKTDEKTQNDIARKVMRYLIGKATDSISPRDHHRNFQNFSMNGKYLLIIFLDNKDDYVRFVNESDMPVIGGKKVDHLDHIIRFTRFSGQKYDGKDMERNYNFYGISKASITDADFEGKLGYRLNFWNRDASGTQMAPGPHDYADHYIYSMNIHLRMTFELPQEDENGNPTTVKKTVPIILDPDTGNMGSNP